MVWCLREVVWVVFRDVGGVVRKERLRSGGMKYKYMSGGAFERIHVTPRVAGARQVNRGKERERNVKM